MFEGVEKKLELSVENIDLRSLPDSFFKKCVEAAGANILSQIENSTWKAYLLSESSLFVARDQLIMITCGRTQVVKAVPLFYEKFSEENIRLLTYERKNEYFPHVQESSFFDDIRYLDKFTSGESYLFGKLDGHHIFLYGSKKEVKELTPQNCTLELLMHDLSKEKQKMFLSGKKKEDIFKEMGLGSLLQDAIVDDYAFSPYGYSLNALKDEYYYTFHVTPEVGSCYVSFETNDLRDSESLVLGVLKSFQPESFDLIDFYYEDSKLLGVPSYFLKMQHMQEKLLNGYSVRFQSFQHHEEASKLKSPRKVFSEGEHVLV